MIKNIYLLQEVFAINMFKILFGASLQTCSAMATTDFMEIRPDSKMKINLFICWKCKAKATRAIFHPRSQCNFQKLLRCHRAEKLQPGYSVQWQDLLTDKLPEY